MQAYTQAYKNNVVWPHLDERDGRQCNQCGSPHMLEVDHIIPRNVRRSLKTHLSNLQYLCHHCHYRKTHTARSKWDPIKDWLLKNQNLVLAKSRALTDDALIKMLERGHQARWRGVYLDD